MNEIKAAKNLPIKTEPAFNSETAETLNKEAIAAIITSFANELITALNEAPIKTPIANSSILPRLTDVHASLTDFLNII